MAQDKELESFKSINLTQYAASLGYILDKKRSSKTSAVMKLRGDKVVIAIDSSDHHWVFFTVGNSFENGSIIDFVQKTMGGSLGVVRQELRPWVGGRKGGISFDQGQSKDPVSLSQQATPQFSSSSSQDYVTDLKPTSKDRVQVVLAFEEMKIAEKHTYLEYERLIPAELLSSPRFFSRVFEDKRHNAIFPHYDNDGLCGFEIRNKAFKGFCEGGSKGLWFSGANKHDKRLVIVESSIKALSYHLLFPDEQTRYASTAGKMNKIQPDLIRLAIGKMPEDAEIIIAMDADKGGRELSQELEEIIKSCSELSIKIHTPETEGLDWNDVLVK